MGNPPAEALTLSLGVPPPLIDEVGQTGQPRAYYGRSRQLSDISLISKKTADLY